MVDCGPEPPELERAAAALLRRRGYAVLPVEEAELREAAAGGGELSAGAQSPAERVARGRLLRAAAAFARLADWVENSPAALRRELLAAVLPVFVHLFLALLEADEAHSSQALLTDHAGLFGALGGHGTPSARMLERLRGLRSPSDLEGEELYEQFRRERRTAVAMSVLAHDLLLSRLLSLEMVVLADIFQHCVRVDTKGDLPGKGPLSESSLLDLQAVNKGVVQCLVDPADPPEAFGSGRQPPDSEAVGPFQGATTAGNVAERCGLPLPSAFSRWRASASKRCAELSACRERLGAERLPSVAAYTVASDDAEDVNCVVLSSDGRYCAAGANGARLWDLSAAGGATSSTAGSAMRADPEKRDQSTFLGHRGRVLAAAFSPDDQLLLTAGQDGAARLWSAPKARSLCVYVQQSEPLWAVEWCTLGHYFISSGAGGEGLLWSVERSAPLRAFAPGGCSAAVGAASWPEVEVIRTHPSARYAALAAEESVVLWDLAAAKPARIFRSGDRTTALGFSADGRLLACGCSDGRLELWDLAAGRQGLKLPSAHEGAVLALDFGRPAAGQLEEGPMLFSGGADGSVQLRHARSWQHLTVPPTGSMQARAPGGRLQSVVWGRFTPANLLLVASAGAASK